jgi:hypothetical protein
VEAANPATVEKPAAAAKPSKQTKPNTLQALWLRNQDQPNRGLDAMLEALPAARLGVLVYRKQPCPL